MCSVILPINWREDLLARADRQCNARNIKITTLGSIIVNDGDFFNLLRAGKGCKVDTYIKVKKWFLENPVTVKPSTTVLISNVN